MLPSLFASSNLRQDFVHPSETRTLCIPPRLEFRPRSRLMKLGAGFLLLWGCREADVCSAGSYSSTKPVITSLVSRTLPICEKAKKCFGEIKG